MLGMRSARNQCAKGVVCWECAGSVLDMRSVIEVWRGLGGVACAGYKECAWYKKCAGYKKCAKYEECAGYNECAAYEECARGVKSGWECVGCWV